MKLKKFNELKDYFVAMVSEIGIMTTNMVNIFFVSRALGEKGAAAYEINMPYLTVMIAVMCMIYTGSQIVCAKDYGAGAFNVGIHLRQLCVRGGGGYLYHLLLFGKAQKRFDCSFREDKLKT